MAKLFIGTSGWIYSHWKGVFYPLTLPSQKRLAYFSQRFKHDFKSIISIVLEFV